MTTCPYCRVRQDIDLRKVHYRDLGANLSMPCPGCSSVLGTIEFETTPPICIERCPSCHGLFFNPGEIEAFLVANTNPVVWVDQVRLNQIAKDYGHRQGILYRKCPVCTERMSPYNIGGSSGVIVERCGTHGFWLESGSLRRLSEWWHAGGKHIHQQHELARAKQLYGGRNSRPEPLTGLPKSLLNDARPTDSTPLNDIFTAAGIVISTLANLLD